MNILIGKCLLITCINIQKMSFNLKRIFIRKLLKLLWMAEKVMKIKNPLNSKIK